MRGRNPSAVFGTLYRQVGQPLKRLPSCAQTWRVENQSDKSTPRTSTGTPSTEERRKNVSIHNRALINKQRDHLSVFPGQLQPLKSPLR